MPSWSKQRRSLKRLEGCHGAPLVLRAFPLYLQVFGYCLGALLRFIRVLRGWDTRQGWLRAPAALTVLLEDAEDGIVWREEHC